MSVRPSCLQMNVRSAGSALAAGAMLILLAPHASADINPHPGVRTWGMVAFRHAERNQNVSQISVGENHTAAVLPDGTVACWGDNSYGQCLVPYGLGQATRVEAGYRHTLVRLPTARSSRGAKVRTGN